MAVNSFVENVNKLAISLYGDGTTPLDVSIITNNIEAITFLYNYISNGGKFGTIGASTVIENVSVLPSVSTEGTIVYLNTKNKLYVFNGASWDEVGGSTTIINSEGGSIAVVQTLPINADIGTVVYLAPKSALYVYDGTEWDKVGVSDNEAPTNTDWTLWSTIPNTSTYISAQGGQVTVTDNGVAVPTLVVSTGSYGGDTATHATDVAYANLTKNTALGNSYISVKVYNMYSVFFGRKPELAGYVYWVKETISKGWDELSLATAIYSAGRYAVVSTPVVETLWSTWTPLTGATFMSAFGGQVTVTPNGTSTPSVSVATGTYTPSNPTQYATDTTYATTTSKGYKTGSVYLANIIYGVYNTLLGKKPELSGYVYWMREAVAGGWNEYTLAYEIYTAAKSVIMASTSKTDAIFIETPPSNPNVGDKVLNILDGSVDTWNGTSWVTEEYIPHASSMTAVAMVSALPATASEGDIVYNTTDDKMYVYLNGTWVAYFETLTPTASGTGIEIVTVLPLTVTNGKVIFNSADKKLYEGVNGSWVQVVQPTGVATEVADASITVAKFAAGIKPVEVVSVLPTDGNSVGRVVYLTTDGQLYRYTASGFTTAVPAQALTGTITATQIANDAITTPKIAAGAIAADKIAANAITAGKIASNAVTAGTIAASAVSADQIASNAITTAKLYAGAITSDKIASNAIIADKIASSAITATKIAADAINAGHIQAGAIGASKISARAITADNIASKSITAAQIQAGAISASEIAANAITAEKILAGSITASKLDVDALIGKRIEMNSSSASSSYYTTDSVWGAQSTAFSFRNTNKQYGICATNETSTGGSALYGILKDSSAQGAGVAGFTESTNPNTWAGFFTAKNGTGVAGNTLRSDKQWGFWSPAKTYSAGGYTPFTGSHLVYSPDKLKVGELVYSEDAWSVDIDNCLIHVKKTTTAKDKRVVGVVSHVKTTLLDNISNNPMLAIKKGEGFNVTWEIKPEFQSYVDYMQNNNFKEVEINSVGEGSILVCNKNGNIDNGDYLTSSSLAGYATKQDDDLLHNYTVAKALESVDWSKETTTTKMIACTYHCG